MSNLNDLNVTLFEQLDRLTNCELEGDELKKEIHRTTAVTSVSREILTSAALQLKSHEIRVNHPHNPLPELIKTDG